MFTVVRALSGKSVLLGYQRFAATTIDRTILSENRDLIEVLQNRDFLRSLPGDSLGRCYLYFMEAQNITAEGLAEASMNGELPQGRDHQLYARLPSADWEQLLTRPIDEVRALLKISPPKVYPEMRGAI